MHGDSGLCRRDLAGQEVVSGRWSRALRTRCSVMMVELSMAALLRSVPPPRPTPPRAHRTLRLLAALNRVIRREQVSHTEAVRIDHLFLGLVALAGIAVVVLAGAATPD